MNHTRKLLVTLVVVGVVVSTLSAFPLTNIVFHDNADGWFTMQNIDDYGADLDERAEDGELIVFTGHPSYVMDSDKARLLFDMPRNHYFAMTFVGTDVGNAFYDRLAEALRTGQADVAIAGPMTESILEHDQETKKAFVDNYCRVDDPEAQELYSRTHATLYRYEPDCPAARQPNVEQMGKG